MRAATNRLARVVRSGAGVGGFFVWWGHALARWLPRRWRQALGLDRGRLLLFAAHADDARAPDVQLLVQEAESIREVGRIAGAHLSTTDAVDVSGQDALAVHLAPGMADLPRWLLLPEVAGLRRRISLPAAANNRLRDVLAFEIGRQTPFDSSAVAFDARVLGRRGEALVDVELVVVPLTALQARRSAFGNLAGTLAGIDMADAQGVPLGVNLLPPAQRERVADPWRYWNLALVAVLLLALAMGMWQLLDNRRAAADAFEQDLQARSAEADRAALQRRTLAALIEGQDWLDARRVHQPAAIEVLAELSRLLPDTTYLEKVSIEGQRLILIGLSSEASALVGRLEASDLWVSPALTGALQPDPASGRDRFTIVAELTELSAGKPMDDKAPEDAADGAG